MFIVNLAFSDMCMMTTQGKTLKLLTNLEKILTGKKLSRGEIYLANFKPPKNGASLCRYFCFEDLTSALKHRLKKPISPLFDANMVKRADKYQTERQTNSLAPWGYVDFFFY